MATPEPLPFFAPADSLPGLLPSAEEIKGSKDLIAEGWTNRRVIRVREHFLVKYGRSLRPLEGQNMLVIQKNTTIRVPRIYAIYSDHDAEGREAHYVVMEYISGSASDLEMEQTGI